MEAPLIDLALLIELFCEYKTTLFMDLESANYKILCIYLRWLTLSLPLGGRGGEWGNREHAATCLPLSRFLRFPPSPLVFPPSSHIESERVSSQPDPKKSQVSHSVSLNGRTSR